jgi:hypothetical protein
MRALLLLLPLAACLPGGPTMRGADCAGEFTFANQSRQVVEQLYAGSPRDLLEPGVLAPGQQRAFRAVNPGAARLRVVFDDGRAIELGPVNLCELPRVSMTPGGLRAAAM